MAGKSVLRAKYKKLRSELSPEQISEKSLDISDRLMQSFPLNGKYIHTFLPIFDKKEVNTWLTVDRLMSIANVVVSRADFDTYSMQHVLLKNDVPIEISSMGIPEPVGGIKVNASKIEVIIVPLLAFDKRGYRVGYGKGFYDKFLVETRPNAIKIGLSFFEVEEELISDVSELDIPLNYCVTPHTLYTFD